MTRSIRLYGHLRGPVTLTPIAERLAVELSLPVFMTYVCRAWDSNIQSSIVPPPQINVSHKSNVYVVHETVRQLIDVDS